MTSASDQNLLFGIMALQVNAIDSEQLVSAMNQWTPEGSDSLGSLLLEQGAMTVKQKDAIESLVVARLELFQNDATRSFAEFASDTDVSRLVHRFTTPAVTSSLAVVGSGIKRDAGHTSPVEESTNGGERYRVKHLHDEGGLGRVFLAHDSQLSRDVALKELKPESRNNPDSRARFLAEAEITGGLEHPSIVPVYSLGHRDGSPFYAMRFIQGENLQKRIRNFHATDWSENGGTSARSMEFRRLLSRFLDVCRAIHYSHKRGILHRDLKPANIMLGNYGETLVVDWGLAKWLGQREFRSDDSPEETLLPSSGSVVSATRLGAAAGTPAFMSPEQARGEHDQLGPATDIYGLGATLYMLLTNKRPYEGESDILAAVRRGNLQPPRQIKNSTPKPLEAICLKAMALDPEDRYESSEALALDVEQFLGDERVVAFRDSILSRTRRWIRKNSALATGSLVFGLMSVLAAGALIAENRKVVSAKRLAESQRQRAETEEQRAVQENYIKELVTDMLLDSVVESDKDRVVAARILQLAESKSDTLDPATRIPLLRALGRSYGRRGSHGEAIRVLSKARIGAAQTFGTDGLETLRIESQLGLSQAQRGEDASEMLEGVYERLLQSLGETHRETLRALNNLASSYNEKDPNKALELFQRVYRLRHETLGPADLDTLRSANNLGVIYAVGRNLEKAREIFDDGKLEQRLIGSFGNDSEAADTFHNNQAFFYYQSNRLQDALRVGRQAYEQRTQRLGSGHPDTIETHHLIGRSLESMGQLEEAKLVYQQCLELIDPSDTGAQERELRALNGVQLQLREFDEALATQKLWNEQLARMGSSARISTIARAAVSEAEALFGLGRVEDANDVITANAAESAEPQVDFEWLRRQALLGATQCALKQGEGEERMTKIVEAMRTQLGAARPHQRWYVPRAAVRLIKHLVDNGESAQAERWRKVLNEINSEIADLRQ